MDKLLLEDRLKACKIFYNNFHRAPRVSETMTFNNVVFKIGQFISSAKRGYYSDEVRHEIKYIFGQSVLNTNCKKSLLTVNDKINACKTFFNQFGKVPEFNDKIMVGDTSFAIGKFVKSVVNGFESDWSELLEVPKLSNGINVIMNETGSLQEYYSLDGLRLKQPRKGLVLMKKNGKVKKYFVTH